MARLYSEAPYRDNYDPSKNYVQQLAIPGRGAQAVEFTQMGTMMLDFLKRLGDTVMRDGNIVEGCALHVRDNIATITKGTIYLGGLVRFVEEATVPIKGIGNEVIGCKIVESIVTEVDDSTINDPAAGSENYGQPGTHRVKQVVVWGVDEDGLTPVFKLSGGALVTTVEDKPQLEVVEDILARRTYDESGNYKVEGLNIMEKGISDSEFNYLSLTEGKAYVRGYEIYKSTASTFKCRRSTDTRLILSEPKVYTQGTTVYQLNNHPAKSVNRLTATVEVTRTITRGAIAGGIDYLPDTPVVNVLEIKQGGTTYTKGQDWQLVNDGIDWSLLGKEPSIGTQYTVKYYYKRAMVNGSDFTLKVLDNKSVIEFSGINTPINNGEVQVDYEFYLARKDSVLLDSEGHIVLVEGKPNILRLVSAPLVNDNTLLALGTVTALPDSDATLVVNNSVERMSFESIQKVVKRVEELEYNQALSDLDKEAESGENPTELRGILTDNFNTFTKSDLHHAHYNASLDLSRKELTLPSVSLTSVLTPNTNSFETINGIIGRVITAPFTSVPVLEQMYSTQTMLINPYQVFDRMLPLRLEPTVDNWIDESHVVINNEKVNTTTLRRWWYHKGESWAEEERQKWIELGFADGGESLGWDEGRSGSSSSVDKVILDEAIPFMRSREVVVKAYNFPYNADNISGTFDDIPVNLIPLTTSRVGTKAGTVRADAEGNVHCKFTVPEGVPCGTKLFKLIHDTISATGEYTANGRKRVVEQTITNTTTIVKPTDPLAQTFQFEEDYTLTGVDLFFADKDEHPVSVQVRNVVNGYPGTTCYGEFVVTPDQIRVSSNASEATHIRFDMPVLCKKDTQYCIVVLTDSSVASLHVCNLGDRDVATGQYVTSQPFVGGVLFSSSNGLTWSAHQSMDMKFRLYRAQYQGKGVVLFESIPVNQADRLLLAIDAMSPLNTGITWYYSVNDSAWQTIDLWDDRDTSEIVKKVTLKAEISATNNTSPMIAQDTLQLVSFLNQSEGRYVSKNVYVEDGFNTVKVILDMALPTGTSAKVFYSIDENGSQWKELTGPKVSPVDAEFVRYEYSDTITPGLHSRNEEEGGLTEDDLVKKNYRVKIQLNSNNPLARPRAKRLLNILNTK